MGVWENSPIVLCHKKQECLAKGSPADTAGNLYSIMKRLAFDDVFYVPRP